MYKFISNEKASGDGCKEKLLWGKSSLTYVGPDKLTQSNYKWSHKFSIKRLGSDENGLLAVTQYSKKKKKSWYQVT